MCAIYSITKDHLSGTKMQNGLAHWEKIAYAKTTTVLRVLTFSVHYLGGGCLVYGEELDL